MGKKIFLMFFVNLGLFLALFVLSEWVTSFFVNKAGSHLSADFYLNHTWKPMESKIHEEFVKENPRFPNKYKHFYNNEGWIEKYNVEVKKPQGVYRIFYVGDSFTEGTVEMNGSVPSLVEKGLNAMGKMQFEVINTGTSSYSPTLFYLLTLHKLIRYNPDLIVFNVDMTDDFDDWKYEKTLVLDNDGNPWACPPRNIYTSLMVDTPSGIKTSTWLLKCRLFLLTHSYTYNFFRHHFKSKEIHKNVNEKTKDTAQYVRWEWCKKSWDNKTELRVKYTLNMVEKLLILCRNNKIKTVVTSVPHYKQFSPFDKAEANWSDRPHKEIQKVCKKMKSKCLDSHAGLKSIIEGTLQEKYYYNNDMHFNPLGYQKWAKVQLDFLKKRENAVFPEYFYEVSKK